MFGKNKNKKLERPLVLQNRVVHTTSSNERKQLAMKKKKEKKMINQID